MGARLLKRWISLPLKDIVPINERLNIVEHLFGDVVSRDELAGHIKKMGDIERILSRVAAAKVNPREMQQLRIALEEIIHVKEICRRVGEKGLNKLAKQLDPCDEIRQKIERELTGDPPLQVNKGNVIAEGVSAELDELRQIAHSGKDYLSRIQEREIARTGIPSLKIGFNNVFGYYIEVRNTHKDKVPEEWVRKQTLVSAERYITEELKEYEEKILGAEEKILSLEAGLFHDLVIAVMDFIPIIQQDAFLIAKLDCLLSFAIIASEYNYIRPVVDHSEVIDIKQGRHPVIERELPDDEQYVPNDVFLDTREQQVIILTGPNMSGKSALLRQTALIVLMAQMGSFVPAQEARIGWVDKIFTRVGASDNISLGESTFMVEMNEAASILNNLSERSLILLDEIGRGTATYDGISIAWAMVEYIHEHPKSRAKTLFATHYHELNEMETDYKRVRNFNVSIKELKDRVIFIRKLEPGGSEHSFGIHVAQMAGMPRSVVQRAGEILEELEKSHQKHSLTKPVGDLASQREGFQTSIFQLDDPVLRQIRDEIRNLDIDNLTPVEALNKLNEIKKITGLE
jgi:DNA mismatch repair protein MutS